MKQQAIRAHKCVEFPVWKVVLVTPLVLHAGQSTTIGPIPSTEIGIAVAY
jgi:hypothetical protein